MDGPTAAPLAVNRRRDHRWSPASVPRAAAVLGGLVAIYLGYPIIAFLVRLATNGPRGFGQPDLWGALATSVVGATISLALGTVTGVPLAYLLARRRGRLASLVSVVVQLPLALPPLMGGIVLVYLVGPYTFLGQLSGERLTQTLVGVVIAQTFVSTPFLVVTAQAAFRSVDPALEEVAATLGYGRLGRFLRVAVPSAGGGIRAGMVLLWLRAFGEYGSTVVLAYHPYTLPVYTEVQFSSAPLSTTEAPTALGLLVAGAAIAAAQLRRPRRRHRLPSGVAPVPVASDPPVLRFDVAARVGGFSLAVAHRASSRRIAILGPSGSGKSLTLRALAGVLPSAQGAVRFGDAEVSRLPPEARRVGYVPQGYGLMAGRTVWEQVTAAPASDPGRAAWWIDRLGLQGLEDRRPDELSGGQRQRVSLARALATDPVVVLLDEPLSALDAPVRVELRRELRRLQREVGLSTVLVTHDAQEAASLADDLIVISDGRVLQAGPTEEVLDHPASREVARLLGVDNVLPAEALPGGVLRTPAGDLRGASGLTEGSPALCRIDPGRIGVVAAPRSPWGRRRPPPPPGHDDGGLLLGEGTIVDAVRLGLRRELLVAIGAAELIVHLPASTEGPELGVGRDVALYAPATAVVAWSTARPEAPSPVRSAAPGGAAT